MKARSYLFAAVVAALLGFIIAPADAVAQLTCWQCGATSSGTDCYGAPQGWSACSEFGEDSCAVGGDPNCSEAAFKSLPVGTDGSTYLATVTTEDFPVVEKTAGPDGWTYTVTACGHVIVERKVALVDRALLKRNASLIEL